MPTSGLMSFIGDTTTQQDDPGTAATRLFHGADWLAGRSAVLA
jgi:hypothetical protein